MKKAAVVLCLAILFPASLLFAQSPQISPDTYGQLKFRYLGPEGNRADSVAGVPGNPLIYYVGAASGGIFKSTDGGVHWDPIFDSQPVSSIGSLAVAPSDPNIVWAGTGEPFIRSHISVGEGIFKSTDAGKTWTRMGLERTGRIARVEVDPSNPNVVFACSLGHAYGPQQERGVFRTMDGGKTWERVLFVDENSGCSDMAMDPNNPRILFAGMWQIVIHTYGRTSGGPGSGLWRSSDGGSHWTKLEGHGLPHPPIGRIAVRVAKHDSHRVYALIETGDGVPFEGKPGQNGQLWRSNDGGENWEVVNSDRNIRGRTHYYSREEIAPDNENEVFFFSAAFTHTLDGGRTLTPLPAIGGGDNHEMWIDPTNGDRMALVHDGGVSITLNRGHSWDFIQLPIAQIYHVTVDDQIPYNVYGNRQDGSSYSGPSNSLEFFSFFGPSDQGGPISRAEWRPIEGGESGFAVPDPVDNNIIWSSGTGSGSVQGTVTRYDKRNHQAQNVEVWPENVSGAPASEVKYRFNWEFPVTISPHDHNKVYVGSQVVHMTTDSGNSWQVISPDLTRNDRSRMGISGGLTPDNIGVEYAGVVFAIAESPKEAGVIWAGTNDGLLQVTRDGGKNWTNVTANIPNLPEWLTVSNIEASRWDAGTAYISVDGHQMNNRDPFIYKTTDYGRTWTMITGGIQHSMLSYVHCVREDAVRRGLLYAGTENGLYVSFNDGGNWQPLQNNLPHSPVYWITSQERFHDLAIATYGRGFWILDDVTPLQQLTPEVLNSAAHLFPTRDAYRYQNITHPAAPFYDPTAGVNPPYGGDINIYLKSALAADQKAKLTISDAGGNLVRTITCGAARSDAAKKEGPEIPEEMGGTPKPQATQQTPGGEQPASVAPLGPTAAEGKAAPAPFERPCELKAGINRVWWDLQSDRTTEIRLRTPPYYLPDYPMGPQGWRPAPVLGRMNVTVVPSTYSVKLTVGDKDYETRKINVVKDPHSTGTVADIEKQTQLIVGLRDQYEQLSLAINQVEAVRAQINNIIRELVNDEPGKQIRQSAQQLNDKLLGVESKLLQMKLTGHGQDDVRWTPMLMQKIDYLAGEVGSSDFAPTTQQAAVAQLLKQQGDEAQRQIQQMMASDVPAFNNVLKEHNVTGGVITKAP
ncbi:MAG: sialidase [Acidobacteria bacterium]|nr:sialidase [Acidobacteriota bacterium]